VPPVPGNGTSPRPGACAGVTLRAHLIDTGALGVEEVTTALLQRMRDGVRFRSFSGLAPGVKLLNIDLFSDFGHWRRQPIV